MFVKGNVPIEPEYKIRTESNVNDIVWFFLLKKHTQFKYPKPEHHGSCENIRKVNKNIIGIVLVES